MTNAYQLTDALWDAARPCPFDGVIDVRSPSEFAADCIPGAINLPVLDDAERAEVGTVYARVGAFEARRLGAGLVSANIARHFAGHFASVGRGYRPLVYCWRGGQRSASLATVLAAVGWRVTVLRGGYKTYRAHVRRQLDVLPPTYHYRLVGGATGCGKTLLLTRLVARGAQVLDLEGLAGHRGSALGKVGPQPSQKRFESRVWAALSRLDPGRPVWVEAESNRIGDLYLPRALWDRMKASGGIELRVPTAGRVVRLLSDYAHWVADPLGLIDALLPYSAWHGERQVAIWRRQIETGEWPAFVASILDVHYDRRYAASAGRCFPRLTEVVDIDDASDVTLDRLAGQLHDGTTTGPAPRSATDAS